MTAILCANCKNPCVSLQGRCLNCKEWVAGHPPATVKTKKKKPLWLFAVIGIGLISGYFLFQSHVRQLEKEKAEMIEHERQQQIAKEAREAEDKARAEQDAKNKAFYAGIEADYRRMRGGLSESDFAKLTEYARPEVIRLLKAPSSAQNFRGSGATDEGGGNYLVRGNIEAQNSYGVLLKSTWVCELRLDGGRHTKSDSLNPCEIISPN